MTPEEFKQRMAEIAKLNRHWDAEDRHIEADKLMCDLLHELGYSAGVTIFINMDKWYA